MPVILCTIAYLVSQTFEPNFLLLHVTAQLRTGRCNTLVVLAAFSLAILLDLYKEVDGQIVIEQSIFKTIYEIVATSMLRYHFILSPRRLPI